MWIAVPRRSEWSGGSGVEWSGIAALSLPQLSPAAQSIIVCIGVVCVTTRYTLYLRTKCTGAGNQSESIRVSSLQSSIAMPHHGVGMVDGRTGTRGVRECDRGEH
jgi:hypothetical protein